MGRPSKRKAQRREGWPTIFHLQVFAQGNAVTKKDLNIRICILSVPGSGSFIRPSPAISYGQSFLGALVSRYVELPQSNDQKEIVILGSSNGAIEVEAIGLDKVRGKLARLERLREISLNGEDVAYADSPGEIKKTCPSKGENPFAVTWAISPCYSAQIYATSIFQALYSIHGILLPS